MRSRSDFIRAGVKLGIGVLMLVGCGDSELPHAMSSSPSTPWEQAVEDYLNSPGEDSEENAPIGRKALDNQLLEDLAGDNTYGMQAVRGQAVGKLTSCYSNDPKDCVDPSFPGDSFACTAFLISDRYVVTAEHCSANGPSSLRSGYLNLGFHEGQANRPSLLSEFRRRFRSLGISGDVYSVWSQSWRYNADLSEGDLFEWECNAIDDDYDRDTTVYECEPKNFFYYEDPAETSLNYVNVYPGNLFGYIPAESGSNSISQGDDVEFFHWEHNYENSGIYYNHMGVIHDAHRSPSRNCVDGYSPCFSMHGFWSGLPDPGSSGSPFMRAQNGTVIGPFSGWSDPLIGSTKSIASRMTSGFLGAYQFFAADSQSIDDWNQTYWGLPFGTIDSQSQSDDLVCPEDYYAAGLVGSTEWNGGPIGMLGLVCYPYPLVADEGHFRDYALSVVVSSGSLAVVDYEPSWVSGGTAATSRSQANRVVPITAADGFTLSRFIQERRIASPYHNDYEMAQTMMCPPGYGVGGVGFKRNSSNVVVEIEDLNCVSLDGAEQMKRVFANPETIGRSGTGTLYQLDCDVDEFATGIRVHTASGLYTYGAQFRCTDPNDFD